MNLCIRIAAMACIAASLLASAATRAGSDAPPSRIVIDCAQPKLPSQREVGELLDQHNFGQVYASRAALMAEARRACLRGPVRAKRVAFEIPSVPAEPSAPLPQERRIAGDRSGR